MKIRKGRHSPGLWYRIKNFAVWFFKKNLERTVSFDITAKYDLPIADQDDVNKLFGIGYIWHHTDSARFGFNFNPDTGHIRIFAYCYVRGERVINEICQVSMYHPWLLTIEVTKTTYSFTVRDSLNRYYIAGSCDVPFKHSKKISYSLGAYFGGNQKAPHDIKIRIKK